MQWEFFERGGSSTTHVDASSGYLQVASDLAEREGFADRVQQIFGDFTDVSDRIGAHHMIALDKVNCCYPNYR